MHTLTKNTNGRIACLPTGISGLDAVLGGGLPENRLHLIQGLAGAGKTTLACQFGFGQARLGKKVLVLTLIAESHAKLVEHLSNFGFFEESLLGRELVFFSGYPALAKGGLGELLSLISATTTEHQAEILIIDGFRIVRESADSGTGLAEFMHSLSSLMASLGCTTLLLSPVASSDPVFESTLVDGLIELRQYDAGMRVVRELKVFKLRGGNPLLGHHTFEVSPDGVVVNPRFEAVSTRRASVPAASSETISVGIPSWDRVIAGGIKRGSTTNLLGSPGIGKTLMGLHFISEGLRRNEKCLILGFYESPPRLLEKAKNVGLDMEGHIDDGSLDIIWNPPLELLIDSLAHRLMENIDRRGVSRLFIDGLDGLCDLFVHVARNRSFLIALVNELRARGVTTFLTQELPYFKEALGSADPIASILYENIMLLSYTEMKGIKYRQIAVMKLRDSGHDLSPYALDISDKGVSIRGTMREVAENEALRMETRGRDAP